MSIPTANWIRVQLDSYMMAPPSRLAISPCGMLLLLIDQKRNPRIKIAVLLSEAKLEQQCPAVPIYAEGATEYFLRVRTSN